MGILKNISNFVLFFNIFIFLLSFIENVNNLEEVPIEISFGIIQISQNINLYDVIFTIAIIFLIVVIISINVLGGGFNAESTKVVIKIVSFIAIYVITSMFTLDFLSVLSGFGTAIYVFMTIVYALGFLEKSSGVDVT